MKKSALVSLLLCVFTVACSSTPKIAHTNDKKPLISDHYLMLSLLDRPITTDQQLMVAFAQQQDQLQQGLNPVFVRPVYLIGAEIETKQTDKYTSYYSQLIAQDINAKRISGPE
ncbi:hypothetical protein [Thalassotalea marina]|uniref:TIGR03751 family conjugal transfer lipoprotein n=1 Tax=Thalassotalea marina TaxID=1673741 RepID=A0A919BMK4_9GAMM|nr:hypothetical protein [Thalassotalea marina]GHG01814.1 hypothetical protein GCM10017161_33240 [Thalassotalea marina]